MSADTVCPDCGDPLHSSCRNVQDPMRGAPYGCAHLESCVECRAEWRRLYNGDDPIPFAWSVDNAAMRRKAEKTDAQVVEWMLSDAGYDDVSRLRSIHQAEITEARKFSDQTRQELDRLQGALLGHYVDIGFNDDVGQAHGAAGFLTDFVRRPDGTTWVVLDWGASVCTQADGFVFRYVAPSKGHVEKARA